MMPITLGANNADAVIPSEVLNKIKETRFFIVENIKTTRRFLRSIDKEFPIDDSTFFELNRRTTPEELPSFLYPIKEGNDVGVLSEAGCPGIADPGSEIVKLAHEKKIQVVPFVGPSSILLGLIGSGFNGQQFKFHGYLPKDRKERINQLKNIERGVNSNETQIFMDTPYRNMNVYEDLLEVLKESTKLCIAANLTTDSEKIQTKTISDWKKTKVNLEKIPVMFLIGL
jgi:16S rRNA (cytidine1402-2'-O)-methyltransferase